MNFIGLAVRMEQEGYNHYKKLADSIAVREISGIFNFLADEELRHKKIFEKMEQTRQPPEVEDSDLSRVAEEAFRKLSGQFKEEGTPALNYEDALQKAHELEEKSVSFYTEALGNVMFQDAGYQSALLAIIDQEKTHSRLLSSIMEMLRHPNEWLENAEWHHSEAF